MKENPTETHAFVAKPSSEVAPDVSYYLSFGLGTKYERTEEDKADCFQLSYSPVHLRIFHCLGIFTTFITFI